MKHLYGVLPLYRVENLGLTFIAEIVIYLLRAITSLHVNLISLFEFACSFILITFKWNQLYFVLLFWYIESALIPFYTSSFHCTGILHLITLAQALIENRVVCNLMSLIWRLGIQCKWRKKRIRPFSSNKSLFKSND